GGVGRGRGGRGVPGRPEVIPLGGTPPGEGATPPAAAFEPAPQSFAPAHDPFAPPPELGALPLDIVAPKPAPPRAVAQPDPHPLHDLQQHRQAAQAPQMWARRGMPLPGRAAAISAPLI